MTIKHEYQTEYIILLDNPDDTIGCPGETIRVPDDFPWIPYPEEVRKGGIAYKYIGAIDAYPYYRRTMR